MTESLFNYFIYGWILIACIVFVVLLQIKAPYGRHIRNQWGPVLPNHWGWMIMELAPIVIVGGFLWKAKDQISSVYFVLTACYLIHYVYRSLIYPFRLRTRGKTIPWIIVLSAIFFNLVNGFFIGYYLVHFATDDSLHYYSASFIIGMCMMITGAVINLISDQYLIRLRKPGEQTYQIPKGGLFEWVSCPNHFGEMLEWLGFAIACWNLPALSFFIWTLANVLPRSLAHHQWYQNQFPDYPKTRKAVFPYIL